MAIWRKELEAAGRARTLERAKRAIGRSTVYRLGAGGMRPSAELARSSDCSGFVAWAIGIPRQLPPRTGGWLDTDCYWRGGSPVADGLFLQVAPENAKCGDLYVYPDRGGRQGHIGVISEMREERPAMVIHCSSGNHRRCGDAVQETDCSVFDRNPNRRIVSVQYSLLRHIFGDVRPVAKVVARGVQIDEAMILSTINLREISMVNEGDKAPDFELKADDGSTVRLSDQKGNRIILYFYPRADTPGCTIEACDFNELAPRVEEKGAMVYGVSPDSVEDVRAFKAKYDLTFKLLADEDHAVAERYGVWTEKTMFGKKSMGTERTTFVIDPNGRIEKIYRKVGAKGHADEVVSAL